MADELQELQPWELPGTPRGREIDIRDAQQPALDTLKDSWNSNTAAGRGAAIVADEAEPLREELFPETEINPEEQDAFTLTTNVMAETAYDALAGAAALVGFRAGEADYNKTEKYRELTEGIPFSYHTDIISNDNYEGALRARERILEDMERGRRIAKQTGMSAGLATIAGTLVDVDLPLTFMSGGGFAAARVARAGVKFGKATRLSERATKSATSVAIGANSGLQAGLVSGAAQAYWGETNDWTVIADAALAGAALGGALNGLMKGDLGLQIRAAQDELQARIARDDPSLSGENLNVEGMRVEPVIIDLGEEAGEDAANSLSAAAAPGSASRLKTQRIDPDSLDAEPRIRQLITKFEDWRKDSGWADRKKEGEAEWLEKFITSGPGSAMARDYAKLYTSESSVLNFLAGAIFESPHGYGRGRATAAVLNDHYTKQIVAPTFAAQDAMMRWAKRTNNTLLNGRAGFGVSDAGQRMFSREVMLEVNARRLNRKYTEDIDVRDAADAYGKAAETAAGIGKGRDGQVSLKGFEDIQPGAYLPYRWNGRRLRDLIRNGTLDETSVVQALANGYRRAGMNQAKDAEQVAKAMVTRMRAQADGVSGNLQDLMTADGREYLEEMLRDSGVSEADRVAILDRISGNKEEAGKISHAKGRNEIDLETPIVTKDGQDLKLVDLMDDDLNGSWHRYARSMAGSSALARHGITSRAAREEMFTAARKEQEALGEEAVDTELLRAMFSHFDGGPLHGYMHGRTNKGIGVVPALMKWLTNLSLLGKLGITQLGETGASMAAIGVRNWADRGIMSRLNTDSLKNNKELLDDMAFIIGRIGEDHKHFAPHLQLDSISSRDAASFLSGTQRLAGKAQWLQGYTSMFNQVRSWQQTTAALGIADKVVKGVRTGEESFMRRMEHDFGLDAHSAQRIKWLIDDGVIEIRKRGDHEYVHRLNMDQWDADLADEFGAGITRSVNQQVQKSMAGEQDAWLHTEAASLLMHLKTFPMQAVTKQFARNMRFMDQDNWATLGMGLATAYAALSIRDAIDGRDRSATERAKAAIGYSNMTGFIPMAVDPVLTMLGLENRRFNQYGPHSEASVASLDVANRAMRIPGAVADYANGTANGYDRQAIQVIPFMNTMGISRLW